MGNTWGDLFKLDGGLSQHCLYFYLLHKKFTLRVRGKTLGGKKTNQKNEREKQETNLME